MTAMKLQKLVYYSQAWHLTWEDKRLYRAKIEAWANGPIIPKLYGHHRTQFSLSKWKFGNPKTLTKNEQETVDIVLKDLDKYTAQQLSELTHQEDPWIDARVGLAPGDRSKREISVSSIHE